MLGSAPREVCRQFWGCGEPGLSQICGLGLIVYVQGPAVGCGVSLHPATMRGEQGRGGGQRVVREDLGKGAGVVPSTPGAAAAGDSGRHRDGALGNPGDAFRARSDRLLPV